MMSHANPDVRPARRGALRLAAAAVLAAAALSAGCSALQAQNPAGPLSPVNAVPEGDARLMLAGHDVVAYFTQGRHALGQPQFSSVYEGITFRFASAEHKALFDAAPMRYLPQYGGYCANGIVYGIPWGGDADRWRIEGGKLYIFGGQLSKDAFELDVPGNIRLADRYWVQEVAGSNSFVQRSWRLTWRVPHYKSTEDLQRMVDAAKAGRSAAPTR
jgi:YHS domain-containing protein